MTMNFIPNDQSPQLDEVWKGPATTEFCSAYEALRDVDHGILGKDVVPVLSPSDAAIVLYIHLLPTTILLLIRLVELGFARDRIFVIPKPYSMVRTALAAAQALGAQIILPDDHIRPGYYDAEAAHDLFSACETIRNRMSGRPSKRIILVDDGGMLTQWWHRSHVGGGRPFDDIVSIQQTASGFFEPRGRGSECIKIDVARSAAKIIFESPIIALGLLRAVDRTAVLHDGATIGVAGVGALGSKVLKRLSARRGRNYRLFAYSNEIAGPLPDQVRRLQGGHEFVAQCDIIFGCTGRNWLKPNWIVTARKPRALVSCSSRDVEFQTLLQLDAAGTTRVPFGDAAIEVEGIHCATISNGGFPINFDRQNEWERPAEIMITRGLILIAVLQALTLKDVRFNREQVLALSSVAQQRLVERWLELNKMQLGFFGVQSNQVADQTWWKQHSYGSTTRNH